MTMNDHAQTTDEIRASFAAGYDLERELLGGGMSRVFLATERALGRQVVIKVLPPELAAGVNRERFRREVQLAAQLQHPHVVPLYAAGEHGEILYYTMPFIEGESLKHALQAKRRFTAKEVAGIMHDVVDALGYAHARGVIHRDIKPGNVLLSGKHAVVTDFGVAKAISASMPAVGMTTSGMAIGTPAYMAPEQLAGDPAADHRLDLYAVGLLAYELLTGEMPFAGNSPQETMAAQLTRTPEPINKVRRDVPPGLSAIIMRCLEKRPEARWQTATELLHELDALTTSSGEFGTPSQSRRPWVLVGAAAVVLSAIAVWQQARQQTAEAPTTPRDTVTVSPAGPLLTRAESLMIAKAVEASIARQAAARRATDSTSAARAKVPNAPPAAALTSEALKLMADSIRNEIQRAVFDSLARVQQSADTRGRDFDGGGRRGNIPPPDGRGAPPRGGTRVYVESSGGTQPQHLVGLTPELDSVFRAIEQARIAATARVNALDATMFAKRATTLGPARRVVVTEPRISRSLEAARPVAIALADSVRRAISASKRFLVVPPDSVSALLEKTRTVDDLAQGLNAEVFASLSVFPVGRDSVRWQLTLRDLTAHRAYALRSWQTGSIATHGAIGGLDTLLARTTAQLMEMDRAPRREAPPPK
ncbi:MAG: serine/threonine-protein kinase [Gemmatimonadota bacterium]|nr:serine/threonine-protein kinase [Gemmatimonadota bacterium]